MYNLVNIIDIIGLTLHEEQTYSDNTEIDNKYNWYKKVPNVSLIRGNIVRWQSVTKELSLVDNIILHISLTDLKLQWKAIDYFILICPAEE